MQIIIVKSVNMTPEDEVNDRLQQLGPGWHIVGQPHTSIVTHGTMDYAGDVGKFFGIARHTYMVTTVVVEKKTRKKK